mgnify:FL=1
MLDETRNVPGLPGAEDVTDGNVDYYEMDWENIENGATEEQMQKCIAKTCGDIGARCADNDPAQTDVGVYEITQE